MSIHELDELYGYNAAWMHAFSERRVSVGSLPCFQMLHRRSHPTVVKPPPFPVRSLEPSRERLTSRGSCYSADVSI